MTLVMVSDPQIVYTYRLRGLHATRQTPDGEKYSQSTSSAFTHREVVVRRSLLITLCCIVCASVASAQTPNVTVYFDEGLQNQWSMCPAAPIGTVAQDLYVVANNLGIWMNGIEYQILYPLQLMFLGDHMVGDAISIGNSSVGIGIAFPTPRNAFTQAVVQTATVLWMCDNCGPENKNTQITVVPYPGQPSIRAVEWPNLEIHIAVGMTSLICDWSPIQETTWGRVKALYQ